jgi:hypothetical protein
MTDSIIVRGVLLIAYLAIIIIIYLVLSTPYIQIVGSFEDLNQSGDAQMEFTGGVIRTVFDMMFAMAALVPIFWFVVWCFHREPDWRYR